MYGKQYKITKKIYRNGTELVGEKWTDITNRQTAYYNQIMLKNENGDKIVITNDAFQKHFIAI